MSAFSILGIFNNVSSNLKNHERIYSVDYNDHSYDSKYILSPVSSQNLNPSEGSNYYIFVHETFTTFYDEESEEEAFSSVANVLMSTDANFDTNYFTFNFVDSAAKTIDIRNFGPRVGQAMFSYVQEVDPASVEELNCLVSLSNYSFVQCSEGTNEIETSGCSEETRATNWTIAPGVDDNDIRTFEISNQIEERYLYHNGQNFTYGDRSETISIETQDGTEERAYNTYLYAYQISESLARELSFSVASAYINSATENFRETYCALPYFERMKFYNFTFEPDESVGNPDETTSPFHVFGQKIIDGVGKYNTESSEYLSPIIDSTSLQINLTSGYISGFSPFEYVVTLSNTSTGETEVIELHRQDYSTGAGPSLLNYRNPRVYLIDNEGRNFYGSSFNVFYGDENNYSSLISEEATYISIGTIELDSQFTLEYQYATDSSGNEVECIYDGEINFEQIGEEGEYEYCLVDYELCSNWRSYYLYANVDQMVWQDSPTFTQYLSSKGLKDIDEEGTYIAYFRKKASENSLSSAVLGNKLDIFPANFDDGYIKRMSVLNKSLYDTYTYENQEMYSALTNKDEFAIFNLYGLSNDAIGEINDLASRDEATGLATSEGLENAYKSRVYLHTLIYENVYEDFSDELTARTRNAYNDLLGYFAEYQYDYSATYDEESEAIYAEFSTQYKAAHDLLLIDNLCETFVNEFNNLIIKYQRFRDLLWGIFDNSYYNIHNSETFEKAQSLYVEALSEMKETVGEI